MIPGRLSSRSEFTPVPSCGFAFVYMVPPESVITVRGHFAFSTKARISLRYEISQQCHVKEEQPLVSV